MTGHPVTGSDIVLERLMSLHPKIIDLTLDRVYRLLDRLGNPQTRLPPVVHVAGTNGKGSVVAYLRAGLEAAGLRVHTYTSPHLVRFHERIRLATGSGTSAFIPEDALLAMLEECEVANEGKPITFFEITTVAAILAFVRNPADVVLLEVGLGGRLDATNVIEQPALCVITPVDLDHQQYLGDTIAQIAAEKAGIMKAGVPVVIGPQPHDAERVLLDRAAALHARSLLYGRDWRVDSDGDGIRYCEGSILRSLPRPSLPGPHQIRNAGTALAALGQLRSAFPLPDHAFAAAVTTATWPARMQRLTHGPLLRTVPASWEVHLDGGHNPSAGRAIAETLDSLPARPLHLVFAMLNTKDPVGFLTPLLSRSASLWATAIPDAPATLSAEDALAAAFRAAEVNGYGPGQGPQLSTAASATAAVERIVSHHGASGAPQRVLLCGSLYFAGHILRENG